jgi:uncharacterized repeat protein (TIGR03803 family)
MINERNLMRAALLSVAAAGVLCAQGTPTLTTLYSFIGGDDGAAPLATVTVGKGGVLYGTTQYGGGTDNDGIVYSLTPPASAGDPWTEKVLFQFNGTDGALPAGGSLVIGTNGVLYGTTQGQPRYGEQVFNAVAFSLTPPSAPGQPWEQAVLYNFEVFGPYGVAFGPGGALYAVQAPGIPSNGGNAFALTPPASTGSPWTKHVLYNSRDGNSPSGPVVVGNNGVLYFSLNGVSSLTPPSAPGGAWKEATLGGQNIASEVVLGPDGVLFGTTRGGGTGTNCPGGEDGCGTAFSLTPPASPGGAWTHNLLHNFDGGSDGANPNALLLGAGDVLYGTTSTGGTYSCGTIYSLTPPAPAGSAWTETVLYSFTCGSDGNYPTAGLVLGPGGALYGTTQAGGISNNGVVFAFQP